MSSLAVPQAATVSPSQKLKVMPPPPSGPARDATRETTPLSQSIVAGITGLLDAGITLVAGVVLYLIYVLDDEPTRLNFYASTAGIYALFLEQSLYAAGMYRFGRLIEPDRPFVAMLLLAVAAVTAPAAAQPPGAELAVDAREALGKKDAARLALLRSRALDQQHPLAQWVDYWELSNRLAQAQQADLDAFYARWRGTYVEDRLRNDWLLELGKRRDWTNFAREYPRFQMNDDREVTCYALLTEQLAAKEGGKALPGPPGPFPACRPASPRRGRWRPGSACRWTRSVHHPPRRRLP